MIKTIKQYSTYARSILSDIKTLAMIIRKYSLQETSKKDRLDNLPGLLAQDDIEQALINPQNSLQLAMSAVAVVKKMQHDIFISREQAEAQRRLIKESIEKIEERQQDSKTNQAQKDQLSQSLGSLRTVQKNINQQLKELMDLERQIPPLQEHVDKITQQCNDDWENYRNHFLQNLLSGIEKSGINLTDEEKKSLLNQETWREILNRFEVLNIEKPSYLNIDEPKYASYFRLKGYLAIHAALGREMQANKPEDVVKILKPLLKG